MIVIGHDKYDSNELIVLPSVRDKILDNSYGSCLKCKGGKGYEVLNVMESPSMQLYHIVANCLNCGEQTFLHCYMPEDDCFNVDINGKYEHVYRNHPSIKAYDPRAEMSEPKVKNRESLTGKSYKNLNREWSNSEAIRYFIFVALTCYPLAIIFNKVLGFSGGVSIIAGFFSGYIICSTGLISNYFKGFLVVVIIRFIAFLFNS